MKLIIGLGNPGEKYAANRHNIGFMAADEIARGYNFGPWKKRFQGYSAEGQIGTQKCILLKPSTYMNESGRAAGEAMRFYKISLNDVIVIHDELDLKPGAIRVKTGGGNAGHNGLKSISAHVGNEYSRVRIGIGHPGDKALVVDYVLHDFAKADRAWLDPLLDGMAAGMARLVEGSEAAFLSEAARGRSKSTPAAKANRAAPAETADVEVAADTGEINPLQAVLAAASKPIQAMIPPSRPGISKIAKPATAMVVEETPPEAQGSAPEPVYAPAPQPVQADPVIQSAAPVSAVIFDQALPETPSTVPEPAEPEPVPVEEPQPVEAAVLSENPAGPIEDAEAPVEPAAAQKGLGTILKSWFSSRVRGGVTTH